MSIEEQNTLEMIANVRENVQQIHELHNRSYACSEATVSDAKNLVNLFTNGQLDFKRLKGNRQIDFKRLPKFSEEFHKKNLTDCTPIVINENCEILDHQHSYLACLLAGLPARFVIKIGGTIHDVITLNGNSKTWSNQNFLETGVELENPSFITLENIRKQYGLSYVQIKSLAQKCDFSFKKDLKGLEWYMTPAVKSNIIEIAAVYRTFKECLVATNKTVINNAAFVNALCEIRSNLKNREQFLGFMSQICKKLKGNYTSFERQRNSESYRNWLSAVLNRNKTKRAFVSL